MRIASTVTASVVALMAVFSTSAAAGDNDSGFKTSAAKMLDGRSGWTT